MENTNPGLQDIKAIRQMMEDSSKFLSLSGLSGIAAGIIALAGAAYAYFVLLAKGSMKHNEYINAPELSQNTEIQTGLLSVALLIFLLALASAGLFSWLKAMKKGMVFWNHTAKKMAWNLASVLLIGGLFSLILVYQHNIQLVASAMLIFYGLALIMASRYTQRDIQFLGYTEVILGLLAGIFPDYGLLFWSIGFGVFHIVYGIAMYLKYD